MLTDLVRQHVRDTYGVSLTVEQTGGGCTALTAVLEGGMVLVLSDGNLGHDLGSVDWPSAALYTLDAWTDGGDATRDATTEHATTLKTWASMIADVL